MSRESKRPPRHRGEKDPQAPVAGAMDETVDLDLIPGCCLGLDLNPTTRT
jgi:hypothetical protein